MDSYTVAENTNSYTVTGLSDNDNYNVTITAVGVCGTIVTSDPVTVYGECVCTVRNIRITTYNVNIATPDYCGHMYVAHTYTHVCLQNSISF